MPNRTTEQTLLYFAYGSNMSTLRLADRIGAVHPVTVARLAAHALRFHKRGRDGTAKCDACHTGRTDDAVHGVVFGIPARAKPRLDEFEGVGNGYELKYITVTGSGGTRYRAFTYCATDIDPALRPFHWYREHVLRGALEHGLPRDAVESIRRVAVVSDPDPARTARELAIYDRTSG